MNIKFLMQYFLHPRTTGAVIPSSRRLAYKMIRDIEFNDCKCIVEYGPGTGVFTDEILKRCNKNTFIILMEYNEEFCKVLKNKYDNMKNVYIVNDSAENLDKYLNKYGINDVDYIISGLPFASLPSEMTEKILTITRNILSNKGTFITFQYTKLKISLINNYFGEIKSDYELLNIPPAYILRCKNKL